MGGWCSSSAQTQAGRERRPTWPVALGFQVEELQQISFSFSPFDEFSVEVLFLIHIWKLTFFFFLNGMV